MLVKLKIRLIIGIAVSGLVWSAAVVAEDYTFGRAWEEIQQISDVLAAERANVERSELLQEATKSLNYPQVDLSGSYTVLDDAKKESKKKKADTHVSQKHGCPDFYIQTFIQTFIE